MFSGRTPAYVFAQTAPKGKGGGGKKTGGGKGGKKKVVPKDEEESKPLVRANPSTVVVILRCRPHTPGSSLVMSKHRARAD